MDKLSYALGIGIGSQLAQMGAKDLNIDDFAQAGRDSLWLRPFLLPMPSSCKSVCKSSQISP